MGILNSIVNNAVALGFLVLGLLTVLFIIRKRRIQIKARVVVIVTLIITITLCFFVFQITIGGIGKSRAIVQDILDSGINFDAGYFSTYADDQVLYDYGRDFAIHGKVLVWDIGSPVSSSSPALLPSGLNSEIPKSLRGDGSATELTLFLLYPETTEVGTYEDGTTGYRQDLVITVVYWPSKKAAAQLTVFGKYPPKMKTGEGDRTGPSPDINKVKEVINASLRIWSNDVPPMEARSVVEMAVPYDELVARQNITKEVEVHHPGALTLTLGASPSSGFQWSEKAKISDQTVLQQYEHVLVAPEIAAPGASGKEVWTFISLKTGVSTIEMEYRRPWETGKESEWTFELTVVVK